MSDYDLYISTNPAEKQQEQEQEDFLIWLDQQDDIELLSGYIGWDANDLLNYVSQYDNDYDYAVTPFKEEYNEELLTYYQNFEV